MMDMMGILVELEDVEVRLEAHSQRISRLIMERQQQKNINKNEMGRVMER